MKIYIVRHGETNLNTKKIFQGRYDEPLNNEGIELAIKAGSGLKGIHFDEAFSSPLIRSIKTVELILSNSDNHTTPVTLDSRLCEVDVGDWTLKDLNNISDPDVKNIKQFFNNPFSYLDVPHGENVYDVMKRTQDFLKELVSRNDEKTYLIGTHGFALRSMMNFLYVNKDDFWHGHVPYNCSFQILEAKDGQIKLIQEDAIFDSVSRTDYYN